MIGIHVHYIFAFCGSDLEEKEQDKGRSIFVRSGSHIVYLAISHMQNNYPCHYSVNAFQCWYVFIGTHWSSLPFHNDKQQALNLMHHKPANSVHTGAVLQKQVHTCFPLSIQWLQARTDSTVKWIWLWVQSLQWASTGCAEHHYITIQPKVMICLIL